MGAICTTMDSSLKKLVKFKHDYAEYNQEQENTVKKKKKKSSLEGIESRLSEHYSIIFIKNRGVHETQG